MSNDTSPTLARLPLLAARALAQHGSADVAIYLPGPGGRAPVLYGRANAGLEGADYDRLRENGITHLLVSHDELQRCETYLEERLHDILEDSSLEPVRKAELVQHVGASIADGLLGADQNVRSLNRAESLIDTVIERVLADPAVAAGLLRMCGHHRSTAGHMFSVALLALLLGAEVFGRQPDVLRALGLAGMLHDLGKTAIPPEVLNKTLLSPAEYRLIRHHPIESVRMIGNHPEATMLVRQMILQHHERVDGRGYPLGVSGAALLPGSKVLAIVDSYHALIGRRNYRPSLTPAEANEQLGRQAGRQFDPHIFACWQRLFERSWRTQFGVMMSPIEQHAEAVSFHRDHYPAPPEPSVPRHQPRQFCHGRASVRCFYAGRLSGVTAAPDDFVSPLLDISRRGMCINTNHPMYCGEIVHVHIDSGVNSVWAKGVVRWCRRTPDKAGFKTGFQLTHRLDAEQAGRRVEVAGLGDLFNLTRLTELS